MAQSSMVEIHCDDCQQGFESFKLARSIKSVHIFTSSKELMKNGEHCKVCIHCKVGKKKAKMIKKIDASFQSIDLFNHVKCPQCKSERFHRIDAHYHCDDCGMVD